MLGAKVETWTSKQMYIEYEVCLIFYWNRSKNVAQQTNLLKKFDIFSTKGTQVALQTNTKKN